MNLMYLSASEFVAGSDTHTALFGRGSRVARSRRTCSHRGNPYNERLHPTSVRTTSNPAYQEPVDNNGRMKPVYNYFMDEAYKVADVVEMITPARFLFNAGQTPKNWNDKMLNDDHIKVLMYEPSAERIFPNTEIKGGVTITLRNSNRKYGAIGTFTSSNELNHILNKVMTVSKQFLDTIVSSRGHYRLSEKCFSDFPVLEAQKTTGTGNMIASNTIANYSEIFLDKVEKEDNYYRILGRTDKRRNYRFLKKEYLLNNPYVEKYNVGIPEANGNGDFGEILASPLILEPFVCTSDTFISIGEFATKIEAEHTLNYIKTKFCRAMLGIKKATQHTAKQVWKYVPLQDFTSTSDINWNTSIHNIDQQLYKKYGLSQEEIDFIEKNVKEME